VVVATGTGGCTRRPVRLRQNGRSSIWSTPLKGTRDSISKLRELAVDGRQSGVWFRVWRSSVKASSFRHRRRRRRRPPTQSATLSPSCSSFCQSTPANASTAGSSWCNNISRMILTRYDARPRRKFDENTREGKEKENSLYHKNSFKNEKFHRVTFNL